MALKVVFMGTPDFAVPCLERIVDADHDVAAVYTQPPRPAGRGMSEKKSPVHTKALQLGIEVRTPQTFRYTEAQTQFCELAPDVAVVVAYGLILPLPVLQTPKYGCYNLHASKLPRWRGAAPIQRAIMAGDTVTAATVMKMAEGLDTGPVCLERDVAITSATTAGELHDDLADVGADLMVEALVCLEGSHLAEKVQSSDGVTYAAKISKDEARIVFDRPSNEVRNQIHGLSPFPGAWFEIRRPNGKPERLKVLRAAAVEGHGAPGTVLDDALTIACQDKAVRMLQVQRAGKKPVAAADFLRGFQLSPGDVIGQ
jgi:methionyl-tRNA formyltransferase